MIKLVKMNFPETLREPRTAEEAVEFFVDIVDLVTQLGEMPEDIREMIDEGRIDYDEALLLIEIRGSGKVKPKNGLTLRHSIQRTVHYRGE